jgi:photosystem II stability/assembly factor-like uncharacterized protein
MKPIFSIIIGILFLLSCNTTKTILEIKNPVITTVSINSSIRAIEVINDKTVWFAGSKGRYGYTEDGGKTWFQDSIFHESQPVHFRAIAATDEAIFLLSIASPALLFKTIDKGKNWKIVYQENDTLAFYDSMKFFDTQNGIAMGDPINGCLSVILTNDGGNTWKKISCENLPPVADGEAAFAASNTNISVVDSHVWIVSGCKKARVFYSSDKGKTWAVYKTPIAKSGEMTGIFSCHFYDKNNGIIFGGDWENQKENTQNKAITTDGGKTWTLVSDGQNPGYRSCVQYIPNTDGKGLVAVGIPGMDYSNDGGSTWINLNNTPFYTIRFSKSGKTAWLVGDGKIGFFEGFK